MPALLENSNEDDLAVEQPKVKKGKKGKKGRKDASRKDYGGDEFESAPAVTHEPAADDDNGDAGGSEGACFRCRHLLPLIFYVDY